jgi:hypothetical protein
MNSFLGPFLREGTYLTSKGRNPFVAGYRQFLKLSDIPQPAKIFVFLEEQADSIGDAYFWRDKDGWSDIPGSYHDGASHFSYADAHCEVHAWRSEQTKLPVVYKTEQHWHPTDALGLEDLRWLVERTSVPAQ